MGVWVRAPDGFQGPCVVGVWVRSPQKLTTLFVKMPFCHSSKNDMAISAFIAYKCLTRNGRKIILPSRQAPFTRYNMLSNRLYNRFDNRLYRVNGVSDSQPP